MPTIAAPALTADRIDYWIPPHIIQYCYGTHPSQSKFIPRGGRRVGMLAIGKCLKDQYDSLATPAPRISLHSSRNSKNGDSRSARHRAAYAPQMHFASSTDSSISGGSAKALLSSNFIFESCVSHSDPNTLPLLLALTFPPMTAKYSWRSASFTSSKRRST